MPPKKTDEEIIQRIDELDARVKTLEATIKGAIFEDEPITIRKTCHIAKVSKLRANHEKKYGGKGATKKLRKLGR